MSTREYAVSLINALSDKQVDILIDFLTNFSDIKTDIQEDKNEDTEDIFEKKRKSFEKLKGMVRSVPITDEDARKIIDQHREEKYGI